MPMKGALMKLGALSESDYKNILAAIPEPHSWTTTDPMPAWETSLRFLDIAQQNGMRTLGLTDYTVGTPELETPPNAQPGLF